jgi:hypothetical protein
MKLTRRDALKAIAAGGGAAGSSLLASEALSGDGVASDAGGYTSADIRTLSLVAEVVYPSTVEVTRRFIETYVRQLDVERQAALSRTVTDLNRVTEARFGRSFDDSSSSGQRESMLRSLGVHRVESTPDGTVPERVRYHLVNTLLFALFTSPAGSELVGITNPRGHPGGFATYRDEDG